jgi:predicted nucleic acid-binding protein
MKYNTNNDETTFKQFRLTLSNAVLVEAIEELQRKTGMSEREIAKEAIIDYLENQDKGPIKQSTPN